MFSKSTALSIFNPFPTYNKCSEFDLNHLDNNVEHLYKCMFNYRMKLKTLSLANGSIDHYEQALLLKQCCHTLSPVESRAPVAQSVATRAVNPGVVSSNPGSANFLSDD